MGSLKISTKRVYESPANEDGARILVDRLWPRGMKKQEARIEQWLKDIAPSDALRRWFHRKPGRWEEFRRRYVAELEEKPDLWQRLLKTARGRRVTLLFSSRNAERNNAVALAEYLKTKARRK